MLQVWYTDEGWVDAYTVRIDTDVYAMSKNATAPNGFNQYAGSTNEIDLQARRPGLGEEIEFWTDLPKGVQRAILDRMKAYLED